MPDDEWRCERFAELDAEIAAESRPCTASTVPPAKPARKPWAYKHPQRSRAEVLDAKCAWLRGRMARRLPSSPARPTLTTVEAQRSLTRADILGYLVGLRGEDESACLHEADSRLREAWLTGYGRGVKDAKELGGPIGVSGP